MIYSIIYHINKETKTDKNVPGLVSCTVSMSFRPSLQMTVVPLREGVAVTVNELTSIVTVAGPPPIVIDVRLVSVAVKSPQTNVSPMFPSVNKLPARVILFWLH